MEQLFKQLTYFFVELRTTHFMPKGVYNMRCVFLLSYFNKYYSILGDRKQEIWIAEKNVTTLADSRGGGKLARDFWSCELQCFSTLLVVPACGGGQDTNKNCMKIDLDYYYYFLKQYTHNETSLEGFNKNTA